MKHKHFTRLLSLLLAVAALLGLLVAPANAASLSGSGTVTIREAGFGSYLSKRTGGTIGGGYWQYTSNDGLTGTAYCVNWGLAGVSPNKALTVQPYNRNPETMGAFANGYPIRTLEQFKELHADDVRGIANLTENEYKYATQVAVWASCGQIAVPGTAFTAGRTVLVEPTADAQGIRIFDSIKIILEAAQHWTKHLYAGLVVRAEKNIDVRGVEVINEYGLEGAADDGVDGIRLETINGKDYYTRVMYVASATSTWIDDYKTKVYSTDAPQGTIFTAENGSPLETVQENGTTCYLVDTSLGRTTNLNANGTEYLGAFKVCIPADNAAQNGSFTIRAAGSAAQYNLFLAYNPNASEQSYIIADPGYADLEAQATFQWSSTDELPETASLQVTKVGAGGSPLEGARFTLTGDQGTVVAGTTDRNGRILWTDLPAGERFTLAETEAPEGYQIIAPMNVVLAAGRTSYLTVRDSTERRFTIKKIDAQNGASLQGAVFRFEQIDGNYVTTGTTGFDGAIAFEGDALPYGSYRVTEQSAPEGYLQDTRVETVEWDGTNDVTLTFENVREPSLIIVKVDEQTGVSLPNATFDVYADGEFITSVTTNDSGEARITGIRHEAYIEIVETAAPAGYVLDRTPHGIHISPCDPAIDDDPVLTVTNRAKPALRILKYDQQTGAGLAGVTFEVWRDGKLLGEHTTNFNGEIFLYDLEPGTYLVQEVATDDAHVVNSTPQQIELRAGDTQTRELVFFNSLKPGIHLIKVDSTTMRSLPNVRFEFALVGGSYRQEFVTDINGEIDLSKLEPGAYEVRELEAPEGYLIDDAVRVVQINPDENANFVFTNTPKPSLVVVKYDPNTGKYLAGATFRIAKIEDGTHYLDRVTGTDGRIVLTGLEPGVYSVQETDAPKGYVLNDTEFHVELFAGQTSELVVPNEAKPALRIVKTDSVTGEPLSGATFTIKKADGATIATEATDQNGEIFLENLDPGAYEIWERSAPNGYLLNEEHQTITLTPNRTGTVRFENMPKSALIIRKTDADTGTPLSGAWFRVRYLGGASGSGGTVIGEYVTGSNGTVTITGLGAGTYICEEISAPNGYVLDAVPQTVYFSGNDQECVTLNFTNRKNGALLIKKEDSVTGAPLSGVQFLVLNSDGSVIGNANGYFTTDSAGTILISDVAPGTTLVVKETRARNGYLLDDAAQVIQIKSSQTMTLEFRNQPLGGLLIHKVDSTTKKGIPGVTFLVLDAGHSPVAQFTTDQNGYAYLNDLTVSGRLYLRELDAPGYVVDTQLKTVYVRAGETSLIEWENTPITGQIQITKTSADYNSMNGWPAGAPIPGTVFEIYNYRTGNLVDTIRTDRNGVAVSRPLPLGRYRVVESQAADFYALDRTPIDVEIEHAGQIVKAAMTNKSLYTNVSIEKNGYAEVMPGQNIRYTFSNIGNNSTTALRSFYWRDALPVEAVRLAKITTGTYNAAGSYKIVYKTNLSGSEYRVLADSMSTRQNYVLDASSVALRLASNEYVTEVMFVFGVVPANFRQVEAPKIDCTVVSWAKGGSQFVNQADVGGVYNGQWIMAATRWVTKVYAPSKPLPRTGY